MLKTITILKRSLVASTALVLIGAAVPMSAYADDPSTTCTPPSTSGQIGIHHPVGADAALYTYNCDTGLWQSAYYTYDPATGATTPSYPIVYTYNPSTGLYDEQVWVFSAPSSGYVQRTQSVSQPPAGATVIGGPAAPAAISNGTNNGSNDGSGDGTGSGGINGTGPDSTNGLNSSDSNILTVSNTNGLSVLNQVGQTATSGNALVIGNTTGGSATSGEAINQTTLVNNLQSTSNALGGNAVTFVANINGDVNGDLLFDPSSLGTIQNTGPSSLNTTNNTLSNGLTVNNSNNASITNNLDMNAASGNATVTGNTNGGNATSGAAANIADVVNTIKSAITAGQSFIGTININGNLNGNIVLPANFVDQLLAANVPTVTLTGPNSNNSVNNSVNNNATVTNTNNQGITNNVSGNAKSGNATVSNNTNGGNATSGSASNTANVSNTSITAFNLTGSQVIGSNDILVFVNVTGQWVGLIVGAPAGTTAAEFGGGISNTGPNSDNSVNGSANNNADVNNNNNSTITNNIKQNAQSGDATVSDNTNGGNATSGNASNSVNLANVEDSTFNLTGWFGILFINVLGSWHGNFTTEPSPGDFVGSSSTSTTSGTSNGGNNGGGKTGLVSAGMHVFGFVSQNGASSAGGSGGTTGGSSNSGTNGTVLGAHNVGAPVPASAPVAHRDLSLPIGFGALFLLYLIVDRLYTMRNRRAKTTAANIQAQAL